MSISVRAYIEDTDAGALLLCKLFKVYGARTNRMVA